MSFCLTFPVADFTAAGATSPTGVPHSANVASVPRQICVTPVCRIVCRSVVCVGRVQARRTWLPLRTARKSVTGWGRWSDGGSGAPGAPQEDKQTQSVIKKKTNVARAGKSSDSLPFLKPKISLQVCSSAGKSQISRTAPTKKPASERGRK
jgi:hypothetical protein